jgi:N-acetyl-gamma-glutamyl-phosphate reductase
MGKAQVAIVGATGYAGAELVRLLSQHPFAEVAIVTSERLSGTPLADECPWLSTDLVLQSFDSATLAADVVFLAQEAGFAMLHAPELLKRSKVIDLSADFRIEDKVVYENTYKREWKSPGLAHTAVYGLPENGLRESIQESRLVANPGCHATNAILALAPLASAKALNGIPVVDSKSGVSGAGRSRKETEYLFSEMAGNFKGYAMVGHRHIPEIEQRIGTKIRFSPHLVPNARGIYTTVHAPLKSDMDPEQLLGLYREAYQGLEFVRLVDQVPSNKQVLGTNRVDINVAYDPNCHFAVISAVQDNLVKGAAGQAIQNMNLMLGFNEAAGLPKDGIWP